MTGEDVAAVIRKVADGDADFAVIESDEDDFMQFVVEAPDSIYLEYVKNNVPMVPGHDVKVTEVQLADLLGRYLAGEPVETLTAGWVPAKIATSSPYANLITALIFGIAITAIIVVACYSL